ncbi:T-cell surface glycoprotein CD5-like [Scleropages formosus]|uniref:T-cell surface glycoprotein CD5-like n=1 Tax=Scleropages formosus TaxID=113540 RepID=UPI000877F25B|nr:T-cell surface glycoprotein CD5 [Scleropages formosus]
MMKVAVTIIALFLSDVVALVSSTTPQSPTACPTTTPCPSCPPAVTCPPALTPAPALPVLRTIHVTPEPTPCLGRVNLASNATFWLPLCQSSQGHISSKRLCDQLGCGRFKSWKKSKGANEGYEVQADGYLNNVTCNALMIQCIARPATAELVAYKTVTWLLSTVFVILILIRFGPGRCASINKKIFERRNREWIGPTQSQSVSFYRAQAAHPNSSASKRSSYPALERLSVHPSREPSSNRNSCDSYN